MNYRDFNPDYSCLPAEAYPYLAIALAGPKPTRPTLWDWIMSTLRRYAVLPMATFLPLADPSPEHLNSPVDQNNLVWVQPKQGIEHPSLLPRVADGNPYSL